MRTAKQQNAVKLTSQGFASQTAVGKSQEGNVFESVNGPRAGEGPLAARGRPRDPRAARPRRRRAARGTRGRLHRGARGLPRTAMGRRPAPLRAARAGASRRPARPALSRALPRAARRTAAGGLGRSVRGARALTAPRAVFRPYALTVLQVTRSRA